MTFSAQTLPRRSRLAARPDHFSHMEDPRDVRRILHPLPEVQLLVVCGTIADCDDDEDITAWGTAHLEFLRRHLPCEHGVPGARWPTILMNRIDPALFSAAFPDRVRESWPDKLDLVAIDGIAGGPWAPVVPREPPEDRGAATTAAQARRRCISFRPSPPPPDWRSPPRRCPTRRTNWPQSRCCWSGSARRAG